MTKHMAHYTHTSIYRFTKYIYVYIHIIYIYIYIVHTYNI